MSRLLSVLKSFNDREIDSNINHIKDVWEELNYDESVVIKNQQEITAELLVLLRNKIQAIKAREDHALCKHRVEKVRVEIIEWWLKCRYSEEQKTAFCAFSSEVYNDELLQLHQNELELLKKYYQDSVTLFEMVDQYLALNERHLFLEAQDKNPNRLFENRGGQLLKDERDRKAARKELPRMEKTINKLIEDFEKTYSRRFVIEGRTFEEALQKHTLKCSESIEAVNKQNVTEIKARAASGTKRKMSAVPSVAFSGRSKLAKSGPLSTNIQQSKKVKLST